MATDVYIEEYADHPVSAGVPFSESKMMPTQWQRVQTGLSKNSNNFDPTTKSIVIIAKAAVLYVIGVNADGTPLTGAGDSCYLPANTYRVHSLAGTPGSLRLGVTDAP